MAIEGKCLLYFRLSRGAEENAAQANDATAHGPIFGPYSFVHTDRGTHIQLGKPDGQADELTVHGGFIPYDGTRYANWSVFANFGDCPAECLQPFDARKADPARQPGQRAKPEAEAEATDYQLGEQTANFCPLCDRLTDVEVTAVTTSQVGFRCDSGHEFQEKR